MEAYIKDRYYFREGEEIALLTNAYENIQVLFLFRYIILIKFGVFCIY